MGVLLNGKTLEPALPDMAMASVVAMVAANMTGHPPLHEGTEVVSGSGRDHEMKMIRHQADAENLEGMSGFRCTKQIEEGGIGGVFMKDGRATVSTIQHMVGVPSDVSARNPRHGKTTVRHTGGGRQEKVAWTSQALAECASEWR